MDSKRFEAIAVAETDNVASLLRDAQRGQTLRVSIGSEIRTVTALADIPFGHKIALEDIPAGRPAIKYGEVFGAASRAIARGDWVHVHNVESGRGRGDDAGRQGGCDFDASGVHNSALVLGRPLADASGLTFLGYPRPDGSAGTRNLVAVVSCVVCANDVVSKLGEIEGAASFTHQQGCSQTKPDIDRIRQVLVNLARNPNVGAILYVSLGCESVPSQLVAQEAAATGKPVRLLVIQQEGGSSATIEKARAIVRAMVAEIACKPVPVPFSRLKLGLKCGSSDTTQGISANVIAGKITEIFAAAGASVVMGETTEFMGAEHIAARHARDPQTAAEIIGRVARMEERARAIGVDMRGGQPTRGNIAGGLTTIEDKSLGALAKAGSAVFQKVIEYGENAAVPGLVMMDSPGREPEMLTGLASAGCNLILFTTGRGAPQGFPFVPVVKMTGNERTWRLMGEHMDFFAGDVIEGRKTCAEVAEALLTELLEFASGRATKAEICRYNNSMNIYVTGPTI